MKLRKNKFKTVARGWNEDQDCVVRAITIASRYSYASVHKTLAKLGRKPRTSCTPKMQRKAMKLLFSKALHNNNIYCRLCWFARANPTGTFVCATWNHAFAIIDGVVHDWRLKPDCIIREVWKISD